MKLNKTGNAKDRKETQLVGVPMIDVAGPSAPQVTGFEASVGGPRSTHAAKPLLAIH